jgi:hypothetical protein
MRERAMTSRKYSSAQLATDRQFGKIGKHLARKLNPSIGTTRDIIDACIDICMLAHRHHRLAEHACNRTLSKREELEDQQIESDIREIVSLLPRVNGEPIRARFQGDPRGATVTLVMPDGRYDSWGGPEVGICVPTDEDDV